MSKWFEHRHRWRMKLPPSQVNRGEEKGIVFVEDCTCGVVRVIEIFGEKPPVIRMSGDETP